MLSGSDRSLEVDTSIEEILGAFCRTDERDVRRAPERGGEGLHGAFSHALLLVVSHHDVVPPVFQKGIANALRKACCPGLFIDLHGSLMKHEITAFLNVHR